MTPPHDFLGRGRVEILERHYAQARGDALRLKARHAGGMGLGTVSTWSAIERLALVIDPTDAKLGCTSQYVHTLQVVERAREQGAHDEMILAALLHDLGKLLLLAEVDPADVVGRNRPLGGVDADPPGPGCGLDRVVFHYSHDEFLHDRLAGRVPDRVAWLIRYHSIAGDYAGYMDARDRGYHDDLARFREWDRAKSMMRMPESDPARERALLARFGLEEITL